MQEKHSIKILYDFQTFTLQEYGGISRYYHEIISRLRGQARIGLILTNNAYLNGKGYKGIRPFFKNSSFKGKHRIMLSLNKWYSSSLIKSAKFDILHPTYYDTYFLDKIGTKPFVITVYDLIHEKFGDKYPELGEDVTFSAKMELLTKAKMIIAISESTKRDIIDIFGIDPNKIRVIYLGSSLEKRDKGENGNTHVGKSLLFVGKRAIYKNFDFFIRAIANYLKESDLTVVCSGGGAFTAEEKVLFEQLGIATKVKYHAIQGDESLIRDYQQASAFIFPSEYEGFGIPVLEAFSCGCPCVLSNGGSLPEVGGDAAVYFDPNNAKELVEAVKKVIENPTLASQLVADGYKRLNNFSWDKTAEETLALYKSIS